MKKKFIIIGASAAGTSCANRLRQLDQESEIICVSDEIESPYNKCLLADYMSGIKQAHEVNTLTREQAAQKNITLLLGKKVVAIDPNVKNISFNDGATMSYDSLLLAVGTSPRLPQLPDLKELSNLFTFHHLRDIEGILNHIKESNAKRAVVVGSGLSGLECADSLAQNGIKVTVVELKERVLLTHVDATASLFIQERMRTQGVAFIPNQSVEHLEKHDNAIQSLRLSDGTVLETDLVVFAIGLQPNLDLAHKAGIAIHAEGIITDPQMRTSVADVYAAGDIAMVKDQLSGELVPSRTWPDAMLQGLIAAYAMAGQSRLYPGIAAVVSSAFFDIKFASCGPVANPPQGYEQIINRHIDFYHLFLVENGYLKGFLLVGNTGAVGKLRQLLLTKSPVTQEQLLSL